MKFTTLPILFFLFLINFNGFAQHGYLHLRIYGTRLPVCQLDSQYLKTSDTILALSPGEHMIRIREPKMMLIDTSVNVRSSDTVAYSFMLKHTKEYIAYKREYINYKDSRNKRLFVSPIVMGLAISSGLLVNQFVVRKRYEELKDIRSIYQSTGIQSKMEQQKVLFDAELKKYHRMKKIEYGFYSVAGLVALNYIRIIVKQQKTPVPQYSEPKLLSKMDFNIYPDIEKKTWMCGFALKF